MQLICSTQHILGLLTTGWPGESRRGSLDGFDPASVNLELVKQYHTATDCKSQMNGTEQNYFEISLLFYCFIR
jgi:hypothetical protein